MKMVSIEFCPRDKNPPGREAFENLMRECEHGNLRVRLTLQVLDEPEPLPASARDSK